MLSGASCGSFFFLFFLPLLHPLKRIRSCNWQQPVAAEAELQQLEASPLSLSLPLSLVFLFFLFSCSSHSPTNSGISASLSRFLSITGLSHFTQFQLCMRILVDVVVYECMYVVVSTFFFLSSLFLSFSLSRYLGYNQAVPYHLWLLPMSGVVCFMY